jgi:hypothetical protein
MRHSSSEPPLAHELEALDPEDFATILDVAIREVLDLERYNEQLAIEEKDSANIVALRQAPKRFSKRSKASRSCEAING